MRGSASPETGDLQANEGQRLWERDGAGAVVRELLESARRGRGGAVLFVGEAGLGKTSVLRHAATLGAGRFDVAGGGGEEMEAGMPFALLGEVLRSLPDVPGELLGTLERPAPEPSAPRLRTLRWLQARGERPLLFLLDDLHWADPDSLELFGFLARRAARLPVAIVGALRPWPPRAGELARDLAAGGHADVREVAPLSRPAAAALLHARGGAALSPEAEADAWRLCRGNPLLIELLARHGRPDGDLLLTRFAGLDATSLECARAASVLGVRFRLELAAELAGLRDAQQPAAFAALAGSGLVVDAGGSGSRFAHPLFARALYDDIAPPLRRRLHARAFTLLADRALDGEAAEHAIQADLIGDARAVAVLARAGRAAQASGAAATAVRCLEHAVRLAGDRPAPTLLADLGRALLQFGRAAEADAVCERALGLPDVTEGERAELLGLLGHSRYLTGAPGRGEAQLRGAAAAAADVRAQATRLLEQAVTAWMVHGPGAAQPLAARALEIVPPEDVDLREAAAASYAQLSAETGDPQAAAAAEPVARRLAGGDTGHLLNPLALTWPGATIYKFAHAVRYLERFDEAIGALRTARQALERAGAANGIATVTAFIGTYLVRDGYPREALAEGRRVEEFADLTPALQPFGLLVRAEAHAWLGQDAESAAACAQVAALNPEPWLLRVWPAYVRGLSALWRRDVAASDELLVVERLLADAGAREPYNIPWHAFAVQAHLLAGRREDAVRVAAQLTDLAGRSDRRWPRSSALLSQARIAEADGDAAAAEGGFRAALELVAGMPLPLRVADTHLALGRHLRRHHGPVEARGHLAEALRRFDDAGAQPLATIAREELRVTGGRRRTPRDDPDRLTEAERRVARLAAAGHTNAEIAAALQLSLNTVKSHLKRAYAKLGISSRRRLAGLDLDAGPTAGG